MHASTKKGMIIIGAAFLGIIAAVFIFFLSTDAVTGTVRDLSGQTIAGAKIKGGLREATTDAQGRFETWVTEGTEELTAEYNSEITTIALERDPDKQKIAKETTAPKITDVFESEDEAFQGLNPEEVDLIREEINNGYIPEPQNATPQDSEAMNITIPSLPDDIKLPPPVDPNAFIINENGLEVVPGEILVGWKQGTTEEERKEQVQNVGAAMRFDDPQGLTSILYIEDQQQVKTVVQKLEKSELVLGAMENFKLETDAAPNDPDWKDKNKNWWLRKLNAEPLWAGTTGRSNVIVAVIDVGFQLSHPDLASAFTKANLNYTTGLITDTPRHGTHVSGIIAARKDNGQGLAGIAPRVRVLPIRLYDFARLPAVYTTLAQYPQIRIATMSMGWNWRKKNKNRVTNGKAVLTNAQMQAYTDTYDRIIRKSFLQYYRAGGVMCKSAGNDFGLDARLNLLNYAEVITVGASESTGTLTNFSNIGPKVDIIAPGRNIWAPLPPSTYGYLSGTSMATPTVCGTVASIRSVRPNFGALLIKRILTYSGSHESVKSASGYPHLDSWRAVLRATNHFGAKGDLIDEGFTPLKNAQITTRPTQWNVLSNNEGEFVLPFLKRQTYTLNIQKDKLKSKHTLTSPPVKGDEVVDLLLMVEGEDEETNENTNTDANENTSSSENVNTDAGNTNGSDSQGSDGAESTEENQTLPNGIVVSPEGCAVSGFTLPPAEGDCAPGFYFSRETIACEQITCPEGVGRTYTLECKCPEGTSAVHACGSGYVVACVPSKP